VVSTFVVVNCPIESQRGQQERTGCARELNKIPQGACLSRAETAVARTLCLDCFRTWFVYWSAQGQFFPKAQWVFVPLCFAGSFLLACSVSGWTVKDTLRRLLRRSNEK
jgi:hypothetical protein